MRIISLNDIKAMSICPAYFQFLKKEKRKPISLQLYVVINTIQMCYLQASKTYFKCDWKKIIQHVDSLVFKNVDVFNSEAFNSARKTSEHILIFLRKWYDEIYIPEEGIGYINIPVSYQTNQYIIEDNIQILKAGQKPTAIFINDLALTTSQLYNDIYIRSLLWLIAQKLTLSSIKAQYLIMKPLGAFEYKNIEVDEKAHMRNEKYIKQIVNLILLDYSYPSISEQCIQCAFSGRCIL